MTQLKASDGVSLQITASNEYGFVVNNNIKALGPIVIFPKTIFSWNVSGVEDINENSLKIFQLLDPRIGKYEWSAWEEAILFLKNVFY